jgi:hypothetical protein
MGEIAYWDSDIFNRQCARVHAVGLERSDSRAVACADDWAGKTAECPGTADNVEAWTAERDGGRRDADY